MLFQAFQKTKEWADLKDGQLVLVTEDRYEKAMIFYAESYCKDEPLSHALKIGFSDDAVDIWTASFCCQLSIMILDQSGAEVMGMRTIRIARQMERYEVEKLSDEKLKVLFGFMQYCDDKTNFYDHFNTDIALHFMGLCVAKKYRGRGLGTKLTEIALEFIRNLEIDPVYVKVESSSVFAQKIFEKLNFEKLYEQNYKEYLVDSKVVFEDMGDHKSMVCYGKKISGR